jgi:hypothetical protein
MAAGGILLDRWLMRGHRRLKTAGFDNRLGIDNGEQGKAVSVCTGTRAPWSDLWPALRTTS